MIPRAERNSGGSFAGVPTLPNRQILLRRRPHGLVAPEDTELVTVDAPEPAEGEALVRTTYVGLDAAARTWLDDQPGYLPPVQLGEVIRAAGIGEVVASRCDAYSVGDVVTTLTGFQEYTIVRDDLFTTPVPGPGDQVDQLAVMSVYGPTGATAYFGMTGVGRPQPGETVVVSAAAGATGSVAGQIAKIAGARVVGIAGGADKCAWLRDECGIENVIDYKHEDVAARLDALCPEGIDIAYENVGGPVMDMIIERLRNKGRVVLCGLVSSYNGGVTQNTASLMQLVNKAARMEGFLVSEYLHRYDEVIATLQDWAADGSLKYRIEVLDGLDKIVEAMTRVFHGKNQGVQLVKISEEGAQ